MDDIVHRSLKDATEVGIILPDHLIKEILSDAVKDLNAKAGGIYFFHIETPDGQNDTKIQEAGPVTLTDEAREDIFDDVLKEYAKEKAELIANEYGYKIFDGSYLNLNYPEVFVLICMRLGDHTIGVLVLALNNGIVFNDNPTIINQLIENLSLRRLILKDNHAALMKKLRQDIMKIVNDIYYENEEINRSCNKDIVKSFIEKSLIKASEELNAIACIFTISSSYSNGLKRLERHYCYNKNEFEVNSYYLFGENAIDNAGLVGNEKEIIVITDHNKICKKLDVVKEEINKSKYNKMSSDSDITSIELSCDILSKQNSITMVNVPVIDQGNENTDTNYKASFTLILPGKKQYEPVHKILIKELGYSLSSALSQIRFLARKQIEIIHEKHLAKKRQVFGHAKHADRVIGAFLKHLGEAPDTVEKEKFWGLAEDAMIWTLSPYNATLVARSWRGKKLEDFPEELHIIDYKDHPYFMDLSRKDIVTNKAGEDFLFLKNDSWRSPRLRKYFQLKTFYCDDSSENKINKAYFNATNKKWVLSFPILGEDQIYGFIDLIRFHPLSFEEEKSLGVILNKISRKIYSAIDSCNVRRTQSITEELFNKAHFNIENYKMRNTYRDLAIILKKYFSCNQCDIFYKKGDRILLFASSHPDGPMEDEEREGYWIKLTPEAEPENILINCLQTCKPKLLHNVKLDTITTSSISDDLIEFLKKGNLAEWLAIPLKQNIGQTSESSKGLLLLRSPHKRRINGEGGKYIKSSLHFTAEDVRLGHDVGLSLTQILKMLTLAEQPILLMEEVIHSLGQPLQNLRISIGTALGELSTFVEKNQFEKESLRIIAKDIHDNFEVVHDATKQVSFFSKMSKVSEYKYEMKNLDFILIKCCEFYKKRASLNGNDIDWTKIQFINPIPIQEDLLKKAFINILDNACKYSWKNRPIIVKLNENEDKVIIEVINKGVGVPKKDLNLIFQPYYRSDVRDSWYTRPGTGIGLAIVKQAIEEIHKGRVYMTSEPTTIEGKHLAATRKSVEDIEHETHVFVELFKSKLMDLFSITKK